MCPPKTSKVKNIVARPTPEPEKAPEPVEVATSSVEDRKRRGRNSLRIDLASGGPASGVNV